MKEKLKNRLAELLHKEYYIIKVNRRNYYLRRINNEYVPFFMIQRFINDRVYCSENKTNLVIKYWKKNRRYL